MFCFNWKSQDTSQRTCRVHIITVIIVVFALQTPVAAAFVLHVHSTKWAQTWSLTLINTNKTAASDSPRCCRSSCVILKFEYWCWPMPSGIIIQISRMCCLRVAAQSLGASARRRRRGSHCGQIWHQLLVILLKIIPSWQLGTKDFVKWLYYGHFQVKSE